MEELINTPDYLFRNARAHPDKPACYRLRDATWEAISWQQYADDVQALACYWLQQGLPAGGHVALIGFNTYEWLVSYLATQLAGGVPIGIYDTSSAEEIAYILKDTATQFLWLETAALWEKMQSEAHIIEQAQRILITEAEHIAPHPKIKSWHSAVSDHAADRENAPWQDRQAQRRPTDTATLIYTSGTTGRPKGVILSYDNVIWTTQQAAQTFQLTPEDRSISYLPLAHVAEQMFSIYAPIIIGWPIYFSRSRYSLLEHMQDVQPSLLFAVPRAWEKIVAGITAKTQAATGVKARLLSWARRIGLETNEQRNRGHDKPNWRYRLAERLVFSKIKAAIGFQQMRFAFSGAAPIHKDIIETLASFDIRVYEIYGQSEDTGPTSVNLPNATRIGSVGQAFPGVSLRIADDDEIYVRGRNVFQGYYNNPEASAEALQDGWLLSGDLGRIDAEGFLFITGRKKEILVTSGGKNIAPIALENDLRSIPLVSNAIIIADQRPYVTAVLSLDAGVILTDILRQDISGIAPDQLIPTLEQRGYSLAQFATDASVRSNIEQAVDLINQRWSQAESIKKFILLPRELTIQDGELTPTLKIKRNQVKHNWCAEIEQMYAAERV